MNTFLDKLFLKKEVNDFDNHLKKSDFKKILGLKDLTFMGIAAIVGAGIFGTVGKAVFLGGPAVTILFIITAIVCGFSALCYAKFASLVPQSGSAYSYAYYSFGEIIAWIIGWDLIMEYAIGNIVVAISWSDYFTELLHSVGIVFPHFMQMDYQSAHKGYENAIFLQASGNAIPASVLSAYKAWVSAPDLLGFKIIFDVPALLIIGFITWLVYVGIEETRKFNNGIVLFKFFILLLVLGFGVFYVNTDHWIPFMPHGWPGVMKSVAPVFFAYIGFDAISTTSEECVNPQKDLPRAMILSLVICTVLYIGITLVISGMLPSQFLNVGDPIAYVFEQKGLHLLAFLISLSAIVAMAGVLLVFQMGQPRIWFAMSKDGLLPEKFANIHKKYKTPSFSTLITGLAVAIPVFFLNMDELTDLTSIGTLFAFALVCGGILIYELRDSAYQKGFQLPLYKAKWPILFLSLLYFGLLANKNIPFDLSAIVFCIILTSLVIMSFRYNFTIVPVLGLLSNVYLMTMLDATPWIRFGIWLIMGLVIYFGYSYRKSKLRSRQST